MKKLVLSILILSSCSTMKIHHRENYRNSVKNIDVLMKWVVRDTQNGVIPEGTGYNYYYILEITKQGLEKKDKNDK